MIFTSIGRKIMSVYRKLLAGGILAAAVGGACLNQAVAIDDDAAVTSKTHEFTVKEIKVTGLYLSLIHI